MINDRLEAVLSKQELAELNAKYCRAVDRLDEALMASLFHPDATVDFPFLKGNANEFPARMMAYEATREASFHACSSHWFEVSGDTAVGEVYLIGWERGPINAVATDSLSGARYVDRFERRFGLWKYLHRTLIVDWSMSRPAESTEKSEFLLRGKRGLADPSYAILGRTVHAASTVPNG
jgi:hypothetical protein